jgi:hypothetical protein
MKNLNYILGGIIAALVIFIFVQRCSEKKPEQIAMCNPVEIFTIDTFFRDTGRVIKIPIPIETFKVKEVYIKDSTEIKELRDEFQYKIQFYRDKSDRYARLFSEIIDSVNVLNYEMELLTYKDSIETDSYKFKYEIASEGFLESFKYDIDIKKTTEYSIIEDKKRNFVGAGIGLDYGGDPEIGVVFGRDWIYSDIEYNLKSKKVSAKVGGKIKF